MSKYRKREEWEAIYEKLFDAGLTDKQMAEHLGVSIFTIGNYRRRLGLYRRDFLTDKARRKIAKKYHEGYKLTAICNEYGVTRATVYRWARRYTKNNADT